MAGAPKVWQVVRKGCRMLKLQDFFLLKPSFNDSLKGGATTLYVMSIKKLRSVFATLVSERKKAIASIYRSDHWRGLPPPAMSKTIFSKSTELASNYTHYSYRLYNLYNKLGKGNK